MINVKLKMVSTKGILTSLLLLSRVLVIFSEGQGIYNRLQLLSYDQTINTYHFDHVPANVTQAEGLLAVFRCRLAGQEAVAYSWEINNISTQNNISSDIDSTLLSDDGGRTITQLTIPATAKHNGTVVVCVAVNGGTKRTEPATLTVQGLLGPVSSLETSYDASGTLLISWKAPFSLNITDTEPDIIYCVDVYRAINGSLVHSECKISGTKYILSVDGFQTGANFSIAVTPVNGAGNGTSSEVVFQIKNYTSMVVTERKFAPTTDTITVSDTEPTQDPIIHPGSSSMDTVVVPVVAVVVVVGIIIIVVTLVVLVCICMCKKNRSQCSANVNLQDGRHTNQEWGNTELQRLTKPAPNGDASGVYTASCDSINDTQPPNTTVTTE